MRSAVLVRHREAGSAKQARPGPLPRASVPAIASSLSQQMPSRAHPSSWSYALGMERFFGDHQLWLQPSHSSRALLLYSAYAWGDHGCRGARGCGRCVQCRRTCASDGHPAGGFWRGAHADVVMHMSCKSAACADETSVTAVAPWQTAFDWRLEAGDVVPIMGTSAQLFVVVSAVCSQALRIPEAMGSAGSPSAAA